MKHALLIIFALISGGCLGYAIGHRSRKHPLQNLSQAEMLLYFLNKENHRHAKDIVRGKRDMSKIIDKYGVKVLDAKADDWIDV